MEMSGGGRCIEGGAQRPVLHINEPERRVRAAWPKPSKALVTMHRCFWCDQLLSLCYFSLNEWECKKLTQRLWS
jgi:hypothetical protein